MSFEQSLIQASQLKQRKLMRPAKIASDRPDTGVTIQNKSAYFVIRDCADITQKYLTMLCYGSFKNPIKQLKGKFKKIDIIDFVARAHDDSNKHTRQLLCAIVADINKCECKPRPTETVVEDNLVESTDFAAIEESEDDIYGDYDYMDEQSETQADTQTTDDTQNWLTVDLADDDVLTNRLIQAFEAK